MEERMSPPAWQRLFQLAASAALIGTLLTASHGIRHINDATIALLMVLVIVGLGRVWGGMEALVAAVIGGIGFDYYFLPPHGFGIEAPEHWIALAAFLLTAIATGQITARSNRRRNEAIERRDEMQRLSRLVDVLLEYNSFEDTMPELPAKLMEIFGADGVALYDCYTGRIFRCGDRIRIVPDQALRDTAAGRHPSDHVRRGVFLAPIHDGDAISGSLAFAGGALSEALVNAIAARVGLGLAKLFAAEKSIHGEILRRSEELKSAVLDAMAHEIRNPLHSLKIAATTLLSRRAVSEAQRIEILTIIDEEIGRMDRSLDEAVQLARAGADELALRKEPQSLGRLISDAVRELAALAGNRPIHVDTPASLPPAECDSKMILTVFKQLLSNALKYSPENSPVTITAEAAEGAIVIHFVDHGMGVAEDEKERIFEKYYRGHAARPGTRGTGLGLASARCIVQAHNGEIWVTDAVGGGSAFHVSLPAVEAGQPVGAG